MSDENALCVYCGEALPIDTSLIRDHVLNCHLRPEVVLTAKIRALIETGDAMLEILRSMTKAVTAVEGMRTKAWEIYHGCEEAWQNAKNLDAK